MTSFWLKITFFIRLSMALGAITALVFAVVYKKEGEFNKAGKEIDKAVEKAGKIA